MSSLLEEAIVDAKALKEAALKNAEDAVLEKYSREVKSALNTLLEQEEGAMEMGMGDAEMDIADPLATGEEAATPGDASFLEETPYAFQNEELDAPAPDEIVEIDFDQLKARLEEEEAEGIEAGAEDIMGSEDTALELQEDGYITDTELKDDSAEDKESLATTNTGSDDENPEAVDEDVELSEEMIDALVNELLNVDMSPQVQGWSSVNSAYNSVEQANNDEIAAAAAAHLEEDEELEEDAKTVSTPSDVDLYEARTKELSVSVRELHALLQEAKIQLRKMNLANAKLVYQNKALGSSSLNERQKNQIVEAVSRATSVEEAKILFDTIQTAVGVPGRKNHLRPETLREAVSKHTSLLLSAKSESKVTNDPRMDRMLRLAGLVD
jgi:hypothetical protein